MFGRKLYTGDVSQKAWEHSVSLLNIGWVIEGMLCSVVLVIKSFGSQPVIANGILGVFCCRWKRWYVPRQLPGTDSSPGLSARRWI